MALNIDGQFHCATRGSVPNCGEGARPSGSELNA
jgi:hypothetical protein